jgi:hypothetical protein
MRHRPARLGFFALFLLVFFVAFVCLFLTAVLLGDVAGPAAAAASLPRPLPAAPLPGMAAAAAEAAPACQPPPPKDFEPFLTSLLGGERRCANPLDAKSMDCLFQCRPDVELETTSGQLSPASVDALGEMCRSGQVARLVRVASNVVSSADCLSASRPHASQAWKEAVHLLFTAACVAKLPDVVFAFEDRDYVPHNFSHPLLVRFVGTDAFPGFLLPTSSFIVASSHCKWRESRQACAAAAD